MEDPKLPSHDSSISLIARLDHLEFIVKYLERKQRFGSNVLVDKGKQSLDLATKEAIFKGTMLDRVASLERRLFQLYVEMDSSGCSDPFSGASTQTSGESSSSSKGSKREICYSFPTFNNFSNNEDKALVPQNQINTPEILQEESESDELQEIKNSCPPKEQSPKSLQLVYEAKMELEINCCQFHKKYEESESESDELQEIKNSCPPKQQVVKNRAKKNEKKCKVEKKRVSPVSWPRLKLLGC